MGYYTTYKLSVENFGNQEYDMAVFHHEGYDERFVEDFINRKYCFENTKWYEHEEDMRGLSARYPNVLFTLHGNGEETGDVWYKYFLDGKMQHCPAKMSFDEFDKEKLV